MSRALLITGATGKQGGATINALLDLDADFEILALTRNVASASAENLAKKSHKIKLVAGDMNNPEEIFKSAKEVTSLPIWGVFSIQVVMGSGQNPTTEETQGKALIDAAIANDVKLFVYSSVDRGGEASIDNPTPVPHFISKHNIEHHLFSATKDTPMAWTVLRPVGFFDNLTPDFHGRVFATCLDIGLEGKKLQYIAASDIGVFAAKAFVDPEAYKGRMVGLAGDELSFEELRKTFKEVTGEEVGTTYKWLAGIILRILGEMNTMFKWFRDAGYKVDIEQLRREHPRLKDFKAWLETDSAFVKK